MKELLVFADDVEESHLFMMMLVQLELIHGVTETVASIPELFGLWWGSLKCPLQKCNAKLLHLFFFLNRGFLHFSLLLFNIVPRNPAK